MYRKHILDCTNLIFNVPTEQSQLAQGMNASAQCCCHCHLKAPSSPLTHLLSFPLEATKAKASWRSCVTWRTVQRWCWIAGRSTSHPQIRRSEGTWCLTALSTTTSPSEWWVTQHCSWDRWTCRDRTVPCFPGFFVFGLRIWTWPFFNESKMHLSFI